MKILIAIANHGVKNQPYLDRLLAEYRSLPHQVHLVVLSDVPKELGPDVEVRVGTPTPDPWSLPFAYKPVFLEARGQFDLYIYTEDDTLITACNIEAFIEVTKVLPAHQVAGFMRYESGEDGSRFIPTIHRGFHWLPGSVASLGGLTFARFTNDHSGCFLLTPDQLEHANECGGFSLPPRSGQYGMLETAATDPYTSCGLQKVICISRIEEFLLPHLPNKYIGKMGLNMADFQCQIEALKEIGVGRRVADELLSGETNPPGELLAKSYYEPVWPDVLQVLPGSVRSLLSIGCGSGEMESAFAQRGIQVTAVPMDAVIGAVAEARGIRMVHGNLEEALSTLKDESFDCVYVSNLLQLLSNPPALLEMLVARLRPGGFVLLVEPNMHPLPILLSRLFKGRIFKSLLRVRRSARTPICGVRLKRWSADAQIKVRIISFKLEPESSGWQRLAERLFGDMFGSHVILLGQSAS